MRGGGDRLPDGQRGSGGRGDTEDRETTGQDGGGGACWMRDCNVMVEEYNDDEDYDDDNDDDDGAV